MRERLSVASGDGDGAAVGHRDVGIQADARRG